MEKVDLRRTLDGYRARQGEFRLLDVPETRYLMIDGAGDPNTSSSFEQAVRTLYPTAYALKFIGRERTDLDFVVPPLEGLWWADDMDAFTADRDKSQWRWTLMLMVPDWLDDDVIAAALEAVAPKEPPRLADLRVEVLAEGRCVQTLHIGTFDDEAAALQTMHHGFIPSHGLRMTGRHHEIYLSDFRRTAPQRRRTILRQPVTAQE
ncbi:MAG: GyrI-like domain-containing protein [Nesterenkonia sp.]|nr:GyrI-like domain-containing protein [Nesterenkonia sp.]